MTKREPTGAERATLEAKRGLGQVHRLYAADGIECRVASDADSPYVNFVGHANITDRSYPMYGGPENGGFNETVDRGAGKKTLSEDPDVAFLLNHAGLTLARTKAKTLFLEEDSTGLGVRAPKLDPRVSAVNDMAILMEQGNLDEMSFAFRIVRQQWFDERGDEVPWWDMDGINRHITEYSLHKGDVSVVNYGANPFTDAGLRSLALPDRRTFAGALREIRAGSPLSDMTRATLQSVLDAMSGAEEDLDDAQATLSDLLGVANPDDGPEMDMDGMLAAMQLEVERRKRIFTRPI